MAGNIDFHILWKIMEVYELTNDEKLEIHNKAMIINAIEAELRSGK